MLTILIAILGIAFVLYTLLGGADFGAGIVEAIAGERDTKAVTKAIAPVWEANHVWLILAIVILFMGFPAVYATISTALHIPLMVALFGIILRGSSFTFRYYDVEPDSLHRHYARVFKVSSFLTPMFLGITLGAMILGNIPAHIPTTFYEGYIRPWLNPFCLALGLFATSLFGYIAAVFLFGEMTEPRQQVHFRRMSGWFMLATFGLGLLVFAAAALVGHPLVDAFFGSWVSVAAFVAALLLAPTILYLFRHPDKHYLRLAMGAQVAAVMAGWFAIQYPVVVFMQGGEHLTFFNTHAPEAVLQQLLIALFVGLALVLPAFWFLFRVFK